MRFSILPALVLASSVAIGRADTITDSLNSIISKSIALNTTVAKWTGDLPTVIKILTASSALTDAINAGTKAANAHANLSENEAFALVPTASTLVADVQSVLKTLTIAKPKFDKLVIGTPLVLNILKTDKTDADQLQAAILAKVPADLKSIAASIISPIDDAFNAAITVYSKYSLPFKA